MERRVQRARTLVRRVHLWLGLSIGLLFAITGLTGSILVFYPQLDTLAHPALRTAAPVRPPSWQAVYDALRRDYPDRTGAWRIEVTAKGGAIPVRYYKPRETAGRGFAPMMLWLDPVSLHTIRRNFWGGYVTTWIYDLHYRLLLDQPGAIAMGIAGTIMLLLLATGLWAWWPRPGSWARALLFKRRAAPVRRLYDIHKLTGLIGLIVLLVVTASGVVLDLPDQIHPLIDRASPLFAQPPMASRPGSGGALPLDRLVAAAQRRWPDAALAWIETPASRVGVVRINMALPSEPSRRFPRSNIWFDAYDGRVLAVRDERRDGAGDTLIAWLHPLHGGEALGLTGQWIVFVSGLLPAVLLVTGVLRWTKRSRRATDRSGSRHVS